MAPPPASSISIFKVKKMFRVGLLGFVSAVFVLLPIAGFFAYGIYSPAKYQYTYYAALADKNNLLEQTTGKKIIVIGGSNVAFGLQSELLESEFDDYSVVNFGLYASLGTKLMMELALDSISEGDIVVLSPEQNEQSLSLFFSASNTLKALESDWSMYDEIEDKDQKIIRGKFIDFVNDKSKIPTPIVVNSIYKRDSFNNHMDIEYLDDDGVSMRQSNIMPLRYDKSLLPSYDFEIRDDFIEYVNFFYQQVLAHKATMLFSFSPVNSLSVENIEMESLVEYYWALRQKLDFDVIGNPLDYIIDSHYFYDTNFHLNDAGSVYRTWLLAVDIYRDAFGVNKIPLFSLPDKPPYAEIDPENQEDSESASYFEFIENREDDQIVSYSINSLKENYGGANSIELPEVYNHRWVIGIEENAFERSSSLASITVPTSYGYFGPGAFDNCPTLNSIFLRQPDPSKLNVSYLGDLLSDEASNRLTFYVPKGSYYLYATDYNWSTYKHLIMEYDYGD